MKNSDARMASLHRVYMKFVSYSLKCPILKRLGTRQLTKCVHGTYGGLVANGGELGPEDVRLMISCF